MSLSINIDSPRCSVSVQWPWYVPPLQYTSVTQLVGRDAMLKGARLTPGTGNISTIFIDIDLIYSVWERGRARNVMKELKREPRKRLKFYSLLFNNSNHELCANAAIWLGRGTVGVIPHYPSNIWFHKSKSISVYY